jgi:hypothetical protein
MWILHTCGKKYLQESDVVMIRDASTMVEQHDQVKIFFNEKSQGIMHVSSK